MINNIDLCFVFCCFFVLFCFFDFDLEIPKTKNSSILAHQQPEINISGKKKKKKTKMQKCKRDYTRMVETIKM